MRKHREALRDHDARRAIDFVPAQRRHPALEHALVAEPVDQRNGRQQRRRQQRNERDAAKQRLERHARARERIGETKGQWHGNHRHHGRHPDAVPQAGEQRRCLRVFNEVGKACEVAALVLQGLHEDGQQRQRKECRERERDEEQRDMRDAVGPVRGLLHGLRGDCR